MGEHSIYISHAWGGESEKIVQEIYRRCRKEGLNVFLDRKDLGYRESIASFMQELGKADAIIIVVSNKYLHSEYCMFELLQIYENKNIIQRIFPIVLDEVSIAKSTDRLELVKYWENETENLEAKIRELKSLSYIEGITDDLNLYQKIRNNIANLTRILKDINTLNIRLHQEHDYQHLIDNIKKYIEKVAGMDEIKRDENPLEDGRSGPISGSILTPESETEIRPESDKPQNWWKRLWIVLPLMILIGGAVWWWKYQQPAEELVSIHKDTLDTTSGSEDISDAVREKAKDPVIPISHELDEASPIPALEKQNLKPASTRNVQANLSDVRPTVTKPSDLLQTSVDQSIEPDKQDVLNPISTPPTGLTEPANGGQKEENAEEEEPNYRMEEIHVPSSEITVRLTRDISSNEVSEGEVIYLELSNPLVVSGYQMADQGAIVKALIIDAKPSLHGGRASLGVRMQSLETVDGQWLSLSYPDVVERRRGEIVFKSGTEFEKVEILPETINLKVMQ